MLAALAALPLAAWAEEPVDLAVINRIKAEAFENSKVMENVFYLTDVNGPRLTGSPALEGAAKWVVNRLEEWGLTGAKMETWGPFGRGWQSTRFTAHLKEPQYAPLIGFARPWSPGTNGPVSGTPVMAAMKAEADFGQFKGKLKGRIVLVEAPPSIAPVVAPPARRFTEADLAGMFAAPEPGAGPVGLNPSAPGQPPPNRDAARKFRNDLNRFLTEEGVAVAVYPGERDLGTVRATAAGSRDSKDPVPPPSVAISAEQYNRIARLIEKKIPVTVEFDIAAEFLPEKDSFNVVGEIPGSSKKDEVVMLGAHLDSWTGGTGATDNAAGSAVMLEAVRILKALRLNMPRTVRIALWTGEEQGLLGSKAYVKAHFADAEVMAPKAEHAKLAGYFNMDNGTGKIRGVYLQGNDMMRPVFEAWFGPFRDLGVTTVSIRDTGSTDHVSFHEVGLAGFQFIQDPVEYSTRTHHSNMDVYDRLQKGDLMQASAVVASVVYHAAARGELLPRQPLPKPKKREAAPSGS
jgi:hypothetical protein